MHVQKRFLLWGVMFLSFACFSCTDIFKTSLAQGLRRESSSITANRSTKELSQLLSDQKLLKDLSSTNAVLDAIGSKSKEEILSLSQTEKAAIMDAVVAVSLPIEQIMKTASDLLKNPEAANIDILDSFVQATDTVNTAALIVLLSDTASINAAPAETLILACVALAAQEAKKTGKKIENITIADLETAPDINIDDIKARVQELTILGFDLGNLFG